MAATSATAEVKPDLSLMRTLRGLREGRGWQGRVIRQGDKAGLGRSAKEDRSAKETKARQGHQKVLVQRRCKYAQEPWG